MANVASGLPEAGHENCSSTLLEVLIPQLCKLLASWDSRRRMLRASSREVLRLVDCTIGSLVLNYVPRPNEALAELHRLLARGCRPQMLTLQLSPLDADIQTAFGLRVLTELGAVASLNSLDLMYLPLTAAVVRAIAAAVPQPSTLRLGSYSLSHCPHSDPDPSGVQALLRHAAPHLQQLHLLDAACLDGPDGLASPLLQCSRLESIELGGYHDEQPLSCYPGVVSALAQLPSLRSLSLTLRWKQDGVSALTVLSDLTRLTCLTLRAKFDVDATTPALTHLCSLAELRLPMVKLRPLHMQQLAGLTALTRLEVMGIGATDEPSCDGAESSGGLAAPATQPSVPVPAQLRALSLAHSASPFEVAALQLPSARLQVWVPGLNIYAGDKDAEGCLCPPAAEALLAACRQLAGRFSCKAHSDKDEDPFELHLRDAAPPPSWPDGYGTLFAAMQPLALRGLTLFGASLTLYDMDALVRHLPLLQDLHLYCAVELPSLPLLCRLKQLAYLSLHPGEGGVVEGWGSELALRTALLVVCVEAPSLKNVALSIDQDAAQHVALGAAAALAVDWLEQELPTLRDDPPELQIL